MKTTASMSKEILGDGTLYSFEEIKRRRGMYRLRYDDGTLGAMVFLSYGTHTIFAVQNNGDFFLNATELYHFRNSKFVEIDGELNIKITA